MPRMMEFGIDVGDTHCAIARCRDGEVQVIRNSEGGELTPAAVWLDRKGSAHVGRRALEKAATDPDNACLEFRALLGKPAPRAFPASRKQRSPEEMLAAVLRELLFDAEQQASKPTAAALTIPASADQAHFQAVRKAAELTGLRHAVLVHEPVAVAMAHGCKSADDKTHWLVFDLSGGSFSPALLHMPGGRLRVAAHAADPLLGTAALDALIVDKLLTPALMKQHVLADLQRTNPKWRGLFNRLRREAAFARQRLDQQPKASISLEFDDRGESRHFDHALVRRDVDTLMEPLLARAVETCRRLIASKNLKPADVERVLLAGAGVLSPYVRQRLADPTAGLGIALDAHVDPLTVKAHGAAVFAASLPLPAGVQ